MARIGIALKLVRTQQAKPEGLQVLAAGNRWTSSPGGWLSNAGVWNSLPDGLHLRDDANSVDIAICRGCNFFTCKEGDTGSALYPSSGDTGNWTVVATNP